MTSERSSLAKRTFFGMQTEYTRRRIWLVALMGLYTLAGYLILPILYLAARKQFGPSYNYMWTAEQTGAGIHSYMMEGAEHVLGFSYYHGVAVAVLAAIFALQGFGWIYKVSSVDFYESQPIKKSSRFCGIFLNGIIIYGLLSLAGACIGLIVCAGMNAFGEAVLMTVLLQWLRLLILFFAVYSVSVFSMLLSKNLVIAVFVDAFILFAEALIRELIEYLSNIYYATYYSGRYVFDTANSMPPYPTSPIVNHFVGRVIADGMANNAYSGTYIYTTDHIEKVVAQISTIAPYDVVSLLFGVAIFALSFIVYHHRKAEAIGSGVIDSRIAGAIKIITGVVVGTFVGMTVDQSFMTTKSSATLMTIAFVILGVVLVCFILEVVDTGNIKKILSHAWQIPAAVILSFAFLYFFKADIAGYDRYLPDASDVKDVALITDAYARDYYDGNGGRMINYGNQEAYLLDSMHLEDVDNAIAVAEIGQERMVAWSKWIEEENRGLASGGYYPYNDPDLGGWYATIGYHMKDGRLICRRLMIPYDIDPAVMDALIGTGEWADVVYQPNVAVISAQAALNGKVSYECGYDNIEENLNPSGFGKLMSAYRKDLEKYSFSMASSEDPIGNITYYDDTMDYYFYVNYPVYSCYTETIAFLKALGIYQEPKIPIDRVATMTVSYNEMSEDGMTSNVYEYKLSDISDIKAVAEKAENTYTEFWHISEDEPEVGVSFTLHSADEGDENSYDKEYEYYYPTEWYYTIRLSDLPDNVVSELYNNLASSYDMYGEY